MSFWWFDIISRSLDVTKCVENTQNGRVSFTPRGVIYSSNRWLHVMYSPYHDIYTLCHEPQLQR